MARQINGAVTGRQSVGLDGKEVWFVVRRSARARRVTLRIDAERGLVVVLPWRAPQSIVRQVLFTKAQWILQKTEEMGRVRAARTGLGHGSRIPFLGKDLTVEVVPEQRLHPRIEVAGDGLRVFVDPSRTTDIRAVLEKWYRASAARIIPRRVHELSVLHGFAPKSVSVRNQRTRWGSCSRHGSLSFNWRLLMVPPDIMDYLVLHELAHLEELNHAPRFWTVVERICPNYRTHELWLRRHGRRMLL